MERSSRDGRGSGLTRREFLGCTALTSAALFTGCAVNPVTGEQQLMLVGEARTFYLRTTCEYATVFNRHPLSDAVRRERNAKDIIAWLQQRGTTHLLVDFLEIARLRSYGFDERINPELFDSLKKAGLTGSSSGSMPFAILYEVPQHE